ncbi:hypothetical protein POJ06DRAFT_290940 [Lipomyces tetrasporus]|uniref:CBM20 domain-containing protein n=1 Tax=Lipomyces tetrasporus TaxID=54092 RepID=A0AAD7QQT6_9ASCO|nr:uncharacterized protein POJ06DRAFT_290940 [Lipomyces tetrasporus]KAJ8099680.1 hypothetical protein POJ06DRAFT_290940 [Lipomyces tetrasporus]
MGFTYTFNWPADPPAEEVYVTGSFDNWSKSAPLAQNVDGSWSVSIPLPSEKIAYKFVVDNNWVIDPNAKTETDASGITNNVLDLDDMTAVNTASSLPGGYIPESGGIPVAPASSSKQSEPDNEPTVTESTAPEPVASDPTATGPEVSSAADATTMEPESASAGEFVPTATTSAEEPEPEKPVTDGIESKEELAPIPTVMPQSRTLHAPFLGTPGIVIPANASEIKEFREVSTIDPRTLNEPEPTTVESDSTVSESGREPTPEIPAEPEPTPIDTVDVEPPETEGRITGLSAPPSEILLGPNDELPKPSIKSKEPEPVTQEEAIGAFQAPPGIVIPTDAAEIKELQQPKPTTVEDEPVIVKDARTLSPPSAGSTVSEVVDTSTSTAPEILNAEDIPKDIAEPKPATPPAPNKKPNERSRSPKSKPSFFDKVRKMFK